jgi:hypothetical protein
VRTVFPRLNQWLNQLPDPRFQPMCLYTAAHLWWHILAMFLSRGGSRNAFDEQRQSGQAAWNLGELCGQKAEDPRFQGEPSVTGSDNAARHANRVDPTAVAQIPVLMFHDLLDRRLFDGARYRSVLQLSVLGPAGTLFPLLHEELDLHNPETQKGGL